MGTVAVHKTAQKSSDNLLLILQTTNTAQIIRYRLHRLSLFTYESINYINNG